MAKKNRKNRKINQQIKKYFDGDPFDIGVERVSSHTLSELFATLGIYDIEHNKELLVKTVRMMWSEADNEFRRDILNFFMSEGKVYKSSHAKGTHFEREEKIEALIAELGVSKEEAHLLRVAFMDVRSKKITIEKMESKLLHIRFEIKKERLQKVLEGLFGVDDSFEFNASLEYKLYEYHFHKILTLHTKPYSYTYLQETSEKLIVEQITKDKQDITDAKQTEIDSFIRSLKDPHPYLTHKDIESSLRLTPPDSKFRFPIIKRNILQTIVKKYIDVSALEFHQEELLLQVQEHLVLPFSEMRIEYVLDLHVELNSLLKEIWEGSEIDFESLLQEAKRENEEHFLADLNQLVKQCGEYATLLQLSDGELHKRVYDILKDRLTTRLTLTPKLSRKVIHAFIFLTKDEVAKKQKEELLKRTIRDFKNLFPLARDMRRKLTLHIGPTNSGKTYQAMQKLKNADTGYYLAPLRLLALEGYENLQAEGVDVSLITGEEQLITEDATHISSTIEMLNFDVDVDVCVIDEVQMIDDRDRGWAWANAIIGAPASEIIMTGSSNAKEAIVALAEYLGEELEIVEFERKNPLTLLEHYTDIKDAKEGSAVIAFSRKDVLRLKQTFTKRFQVSVIYGNLSPEVRREEARRFREKETQVLISTDAIAMGMNLPIKTILFSKAEKFDGIMTRNLMPSEIHQISGRAGRFGLDEEGFVGALNKETLKIVKKNFNKKDYAISIPFRVMANLEHIKLVSTILEENSLSEILNFFAKNMKFNGPFIANNIDDMLEASKIVDSYDLDIATKYHLACAPLTLKSPYILSAYESYILSLEKKVPIAYHPPKLSGDYAQTSDELLRAEDMVKEISLYLWLSYRFQDFFLDSEKARQYRGVLNRYIEESLQQNYLTQRCRICSAPLPRHSKYQICQKCFKKHYTHKR